MNGFHALLFSEIAPNNLLAQSEQLPKSTAGNNEFFQLFTAKTIATDEGDFLSEHLLTVIHQLSEQLELDEMTYDQLIAFVQTLVNDATLTGEIDDQFLNGFLISIGQFFEQMTEIPANSAVEKLLATLKNDDYFNPMLAKQLVNDELYFNLANNKGPIQLNMVHLSNDRDRKSTR